MLVLASTAPATRLPTPVACAHGPATLLSLWAVGLKPSTHRTYVKSLNLFAAFLGVNLDALPDVLLTPHRAPTYAAVRRYRGHLLARGCAPSTVNVALAAIRSLVSVAREAELIPWTLEVRSVRVVAYRDTRGPCRADVAALLMAATAIPDPKQACRAQVVIRLLFDLALRCGELSSLQWCEVESDTVRPTAIWILGKGRGERQRLPLPMSTGDSLAAWRRISSGPGGAGFSPDPNAHVVALTTRGVAKLLERLSIAARISHVNPHGLRHASITTALDAGEPVRRVRAFSRHTRLDTLLRYDDNRAHGADSVAVCVAGSLTTTPLAANIAQAGA
ncbi:tyrosine recombinase XerC [soil metagenome]